MKKGKNRNAKEIPFDIDGHTYLLDSQEEWCMFNWVKEMKERGLLLEYIYQPQAYELSPKYDYVPYPEVKNKKGEVKSKFLMHPHIYTADFTLKFDATNLKLMEYLSQAFKVRCDGWNLDIGCGCEGYVHVKRWGKKFLNKSEVDDDGT